MINRYYSNEKRDELDVSDSKKCDKRKSGTVEQISEKTIHRYDVNKEFDKSHVSNSKKCNKLIFHSSFTEGMSKQSNKSNNHWSKESMDSAQVNTEWNDINEVIESDFLISPGDIYPNCKVELQDAWIADETKKKFEDICDHHQEVFSKNNRDIGRTQLIEMEIDTGNSVP